MMTVTTGSTELANAAPGAKSQVSIIAPQRISLALQGRWNPIRGLTPELLVSHIDAFNMGRLRSLAMLMDGIEQRDIGIKTVVAKRKKAVSRLPWEILTAEGAPESDAEAHKATLLWFYGHLTASDVLSQDKVGGFSALIRQMMDAQGKGYACHEILWQPKASGEISAEFRFCPLWWFEGTTGRLRFLPEEYALNGVDLEEGGWLVSAGDGLMIPTAIAYIYKQWPLRDWSAFCEKFGLPGVIGSTDAQPGSTEWQAISTAVAALINDWACVKSKGDLIELLEAKSGGTNLPFPPLIEYMDRKIAALWRGADLSTISQGNQGSGASLQGDEADMLLEDDAAWIEETLDRQISRTVIRYVHGADEPLAYLKLITPKKRQVDADDKAIRLCLDAGIPLGVDATRERLGLPKPDDDDEVLEKASSEPVSDSAVANGSKTPQDASLANSAPATPPGSQKLKLKAVKGQGFDSGPELAPEYLAAAREQFGKALADDLAPLRRRLAAIEAISDPEIQKTRLAALLAEWDRLAGDITADPEAAQALARIQGAAVADGLTGGRGSDLSNAGNSDGAKKGWMTRRGRATTRDDETNRGRRSMETAMATRRDVMDAMEHPDFGAVDFRWGNDNEGLRHIELRAEQRLAKFKDGITPKMVLEKMPEVIAQGTVTARGRTVRIEKDGWAAILASDYHGAPSNHWLLSGFDISPSKAKR